MSFLQGLLWMAFGYLSAGFGYWVVHGDWPDSRYAFAVGGLVLAAMAMERASRK